MEAPGPGRTLRPVRPLLALVAVAAVLLAGCGPQGPAEQGGDPGDPLDIVAALPSPGDLRGPPAEKAGPAELARAFTGREDPELADIIDSRDPSAAAVRSWSTPAGGTLTVAASVWPSHLVATGVGSDLAAALVEDGGRAWTPTGLPGSRGALRDDPPEVRLGDSVGPNALYARATGDVGQDVVVRAMERMRLVLEGQVG
jgi:hypothetical protein